MNKLDRWIAIGGTSLGLALGLLLTGCDNKNIVPPIPRTNYSTTKYGWAYSVEVIDGCQYINIGRGLAHKGNCTNSIHIYRVENGK